MGKLTDVDELREAFSHDIMGGLNWDRILREAKTVDAVPVVPWYVDAITAWYKPLDPWEGGHGETD